MSICDWFHEACARFVIVLVHRWLLSFLIARSTFWINFISIMFLWCFCRIHSLQLTFVINLRVFFRIHPNRWCATESHEVGRWLLGVLQVAHVYDFYRLDKSNWSSITWLMRSNCHRKCSSNWLMTASTKVWCKLPPELSMIDSTLPIIWRRFRCSQTGY